MHHALVIIALAASIWLVMQSSNRLFPMLAVVASGLEVLIAFGVISLSIAKYRIDVILPALLVVAAGVCWARVTTKGTITAATAATLIGAIQLLGALHVLD